MLDIFLEQIQIFVSFILGLCLLMVVHEFGHFLPARLFGMRVEKFFIFLDWPIKLFSFRKNETEYGIGVIPVLAYVKISGMIDESLDDSIENRPIQPWEFRAKPVWQRLIVMIGGVTMNAILGILIFTGLKFAYGEIRTPISEINKQGGIYVAPGSFADTLGFETGDQITQINGKNVRYFEDLKNFEILLGDAVYFQVIRSGNVMKVSVPNNSLDIYTDDRYKDQPFFTPILPCIIDSILPGSAAAMARIQKGDKILAVNNTPIASYNEFSSYIKQRHQLKLQIIRKGYERNYLLLADTASNYGFTIDSLQTVQVVIPGSPAAKSGLQIGDTIKRMNQFDKAFVKDFRKYFEYQYGSKISVNYLRNGDTLTSNLVPLSFGKPFGITVQMNINFEKEPYSLPGAFIAGSGAAFSVITSNIKGFRKIFRGEADPQKSLSGPIKIYGMYSDVQKRGFASILNFLGVISMVLAFMNILPILPVLDGAHICFLILEAIRGKPLPTKVQITIMNIGFLMFVALSLLIFYNDLSQLF